MMNGSQEKKVYKTTVKLTTSAPSTLIKPRTKIQIKGRIPDTKYKNNDETKKIDEQFTIEKLQELRLNGEATPPFDSGFFGNHTTNTNDDDSTKIKETDDRFQNIGIAIRRRSIDSDRECEPIIKVQHAMYRCQPVYNPMVTTTPALQRSNTVNQISKDDTFLKRRTQSTSDRRFSSMRQPKTSFERPHASASTLEKPKSAKLQAFLSLRQNNLDEGVSTFTQDERMNFTKKIKNTPARQYSIERTVTGSASPKFHRRATLGNASAPTSGRITPTLFDPEHERKKLFEFNEALSNAVWRKRSSVDS